MLDKLAELSSELFQLTNPPLCVAEWVGGQRMVGPSLYTKQAHSLTTIPISIICLLSAQISSQTTKQNVLILIHLRKNIFNLFS